MIHLHREFRGPELNGEQDEGFTLVELLVVVTILPLVVGALALGLTAILNLQPGVSGRIADVSDSQVVGTVFQTDVQGAASLTTSNSSLLSPALCGTGTSLFSMQFSDGSVVSYAEVPTGTTQTLQRLHCSSGSNTPDATTTLSYDLPLSQQAPTISCRTTCPSYGNNWFTTAGILSVTFSVTEPKSSLNYKLVAVPGLWNNNSGGVPGGGTVVPIVVLSNCSTGPALSLSGNSTLNVGSAPDYGQIQVNPSCNGNGISVSNPATLNDGSVTQSPTDPLTGVSPPLNPSTVLTGTCSAGSCSPGEYSTAPALNNNGSLTFAPGNYVFDQPFVIPNNATVTFGAGTIWFKGGLTLNNGSVNFGSGTVIFGNSASDTCAGLACLTLTSGSNLLSQSPQGALLYVEAGSANLAAGATVNLNGVQNAGGIANSDIALWDAAASGSNYPLTFNSGSTGTSNGGIYAPAGNVSMAQNGASGYAYIDAYTLTISNLTTLGVG